MNQRILIVEDEPIILAVLQMAFEDQGWEVTPAANGEDALRQMASYGMPFQAIVTDIHLGGPTDGWAVAEFARRLADDLPVLYISGHGEDDWARRGVCDSVMLAKPFLPDRLVGKTLALVNERPAYLWNLGDAVEHRAS